jgi:hypothetical protein
VLWDYITVSWDYVTDQGDFVSEHWFATGCWASVCHYKDYVIECRDCVIIAGIMSLTSEIIPLCTSLIWQ